MTKDIIDTRLSYSSATLIKNCETRYCHHKVWNTPKDEDYEDSTVHFDVGKAFHWVLEENGHSEDRLEELLDAACKTYSVENFKAMLHAMLLRYLQCHKKSGLQVVKCELAMSNKEFLGFIDVILKDDKGNWWIADLKTASTVNDLTFARLHEDTQLNLYAHFYDEIAGVLHLDPKKFQGVRYRTTTKSKLKQKNTEGYKDFVLRMAGSIKSYDVMIYHDQMNTKEIYDDHLKLHKKSLRFRKGTLKPTKNRSYCDSYFSPCPYWSECYGDIFTRCNPMMLTSDNV